MRPHCLIPRQRLNINLNSFTIAFGKYYFQQKQAGLATEPSEQEHTHD